VIKEHVFQPADGVELPLRCWLPETSPQAIIIALHGFNDYSSAFAMPGHYFKQHSIATYSYDIRGFGGTSYPGIWAGNEQLWSDLSQMILAVNRQHPDVPIFLMGESMGGAIAASAVTQPAFPDELVHGIILSAPALWGGDEMNLFYRALLWTAAHSYPSASLTGKGLKIQASDNIPMLRQLGRDPKVIKRTRIDAVYGLLGMMDAATDRVQEIKTPLLVLYGSKDQIIPPHSIESFVLQLKAPYKLAVYPEGWHLLLRDLQAETVWNDMREWIKNPQNPLPSGHEVVVPDRKR
jgi:alpha-beta hydrolase superfamily lysophospholipase